MALSGEIPPKLNTTSLRGDFSIAMIATPPRIRAILNYQGIEEDCLDEVMGKESDDGGRQKLRAAAHLPCVGSMAMLVLR